MALETLAGIKTIDGFDVIELSVRAMRPVSPEDYVVINHMANSVTFKLQNEPIQQTGVNGCQVDTIIEAALLIVRGLNKKLPCRENSLVITKLEEALHWLKHRRVDREKYEVEGTNQP